MLQVVHKYRRLEQKGSLEEKVEKEYETSYERTKVLEKREIQVRERKNKKLP